MEAETFANYVMVMQVDQAGWHRADDLQVPETIRLIFHPLSSRSQSGRTSLEGAARELSAQSGLSILDALIEVQCQALTELTDDKERVRSMMLFPHFRIDG
jgi:hypothetical protein